MILEHVNCTVSDLERSVRFYSNAFGFEVRWRGKAMGESGPIPAAHVGCPDEASYLSLFEAQRPGRVANDYAPPGINHFGLVVDDLPAARQRLVDAGVDVRDGLEYDPGRRVYVFDPDGIEIEVVAYS